MIVPVRVPVTAGAGRITVIAGFGVTAVMPVPAEAVSRQ